MQPTVHRDACNLKLPLRERLYPVLWGQLSGNKQGVLVKFKKSAQIPGLHNFPLFCSLQLPFPFYLALSFHAYFFDLIDLQEVRVCIRETLGSSFHF